MGWASEDELMGLGMPPQLAFLVGDNPASFSGKGTTQAGATILLNNNCELLPSASNTNFILQHIELNMAVWVFNSQSTTAVVNAPVNATLNGSSNGTLSILQNKAAVFWEYKKGFWASILTN